MRLKICVVGKLKDAGLITLCGDYARRVQRHHRFEQIEARDDAALSRAASPKDFLVALEVGGKTYSSREFAAKVQRWSERKGGRVTFLIGGANGIPAELSGRADAQLSLSSMTLPHRIARVLLCEQLYRAMTIWRGEPYARED